MIDQNLRTGLFQEISQFEVIDAHEHLPPEADRVALDVDMFILFSHYSWRDLLRAGMTQEQHDSLYDHSIPIEQRWKTFEPFWERIRFTSYSRAALIAARKFYGADDINESTCKSISQAAKEFNKPGIYRKVLRDACNIRTALTQCQRTDLGTDLLTPVMPLVYETESWEQLNHPCFAPDNEVSALDDYLDAVSAYVPMVKAEGAVGLKLIVQRFQEPDRQAAERVFNRIKNGNALESSERPGWKTNPLRDYIVDHALRVAAEHDMTVAVHAGYWGDFRELDPLHLIPILMRFPQIRFDVYHVGYPFVRETLMLGKGFDNVWLNFAWTHIISQKFAKDALDEAIDLVPLNKILGFGGDYGKPVEKVYGHLTMAREDIAEVLADRVERGQMTEEKAVQIAKMWLWDNVKELYGLDV